MSFLDEPEEQAPPSINLTPMVDVLFSILAFFIVSTLFLSRWQGLPVALPEAAQGSGKTPPELTITIQADGAIALDKIPISLTDLKPKILSQIQSQSRSQSPTQQSLVVAINADTQVNHGRVVQVMDRLQTIDGIQLAIATQPPQSP